MPAAPPPRRAQAEKAAAVLERSLARFRGDLTVADAAARGGLALRDAEAALFHLASEYRGHLKATSTGDLVFSFPRGLEKPPEKSALRRTLRAAGRSLAAAGRFVVRAWVSVVMVGYAVVFLLLLLALLFKSDDNDSAGDAFAVVLRVLAEALFWTFHPLSPVIWESEPAWMHGRRQRARKLPFYERVNRFVFGPPRPQIDARETERRVLGEVRRLAGRVGPADVMRVTGAPREEAEALLCRLVVDHDGEIDVSEEGAVIYRFPALRRTAGGELARATVPSPAWTQRESPPPITGNTAGTNVLLGLVNGFNLAASTAFLGADGPAFWALGAIPFGFSSSIFALPAVRTALHGRARARAARENGRRALLRAILERRPGETPTVAQLQSLWLSAAGAAVTPAALTDEVRRLGGEPDVLDDGRHVFRFPDLDRERPALEAARAAAPETERSAGEVVFSSDE